MVHMAAVWKNQQVHLLRSVIVDLCILGEEPKGRLMRLIYLICFKNMHMLLQLVEFLCVELATCGKMWDVISLQVDGLKLDMLKTIHFGWLKHNPHSLLVHVPLGVLQACCEAHMQLPSIWLCWCKDVHQLAINLGNCMFALASLSHQRGWESVAGVQIGGRAGVFFDTTGQGLGPGWGKDQLLNHRPNPNPLLALHQAALIYTSDFTGAD